MWNRKDSSPDNTIKKITDMLNSIELFTEIVDEHSYEDNWFSLTVIFKDFPYIYANGKGITMEYAMASAYGELMERLQTGQLFDNLYWRDIKDNASYEKFPFSRLIYLYRFLFPNIVRCFSDDELFLFLDENPTMQQLRLYHSLKDETNILLPHGFIYALEGSNGTCAGNTKEEALVQGLCEIFERHVQKELFYGQYSENDVPNIPIELLQELNSYSMIQKIIDNGYHVVIKDLTFKGKFPVLGILILNRKRTRYFFSLGSDIDIDICLQRCITELFQGRDFNITFRETMKKVIDAENISTDNLTLNNNDENYVLTLKSHNGCIPHFMLIDAPMTTNIELKPFCSQKRENIDALEYIKPIMLKYTSDIFVLDCSYLGFPAYRLYCPDFNDVYYYNHEEFFANISYENKIKVNRPPMPKRFDKDYLKYLSELANINRNVGFFDFTKYMGITCKSLGAFEYLSDLRAFCLKLSLQHKNYQYAQYYINLIIDSSSGTNEKLQNLKQCIIYKINGISDDNIKRLLQIPYSEEEVDDLFNLLYVKYSYKLEFPNCPNCDECKLIDICQYEKWKKTISILDNKKSTYSPFYYINEKDASDGFIGE